jgi:signal transduction histidine kinase
MGVASSPGPQRPYPARRSIRFTFAAIVTVPVVCLVVLWGVAVSIAPGGAVVRRSLFSHSHSNLTEVALYVGAGLIVVLAAVILMGSFARRLSRDMSGLEATARQLAREQLPKTMESLRVEADQAESDDSLERPRVKTTEIASVAAAIAGLRHTAVAAAAEGVSLRNGVAQVFVSLARRNQSLLQRQLRLIDALEQKAADPAALADLFSLDHLTTRMRRHAENLIILSGAAPGRTWSEPVPVIDVVRGALAEVEDYQRIRVITRTQDAVTGAAVADMIHLLAELIENAALFSPSGTRVEVRAERVANGFAIEVEDRGLGIQPGVLSEINRQLVNPPDFALADPDRLGLFVVGKLAARHGIRVSLNPSPYGGTTAVALIPHSIVLPAAGTVAAALQEAAAIGRPAELARGSGDSLALMGRHASGPSPAIATAEQPAARTDSADGFPTAGRRSSFLTPGHLDSSLNPGSFDSSRSLDSLDSLDSSGSSGSAASPGSSFTPGNLGSAASSGRSFTPGDLGSSLGAGGRDAPVSPDSLPGRLSPARPEAPVSPDSLPGSLSRPGGPDAPARSLPARTPAAGTYRGLPRRVRQANLSPHLKNSSPQDVHAAQAEPAPGPSGERSPERARDVVASFRTGWQRESQADTPDPQSETWPGSIEQQDSTAREGEET